MQKSVVILGAGISGLMAAHDLRRHGFQVTVLDKGNRAGGRLATRPFEGAIFDYGAQYFTVRHERFASYQRAWETKGIIRLWDRDRYIGQAGMNSIATHLCQGLDLRCGTKVRQIFESAGVWNLETDFDEVLHADAVISTCPVPQTLAMLDRKLPELEAITYDRCLALMAILSEAPDLPEPGYKQIDDGGPVTWIADNRRKGISPSSHNLTIHASAQFSLNHWERNAEDIAPMLLNGYQATAWKLHRWKYAKPTVQHNTSFYEVDSKKPLLLAGDAFGGARVEGAALSGLFAAERLRELLS
ncbi:NAD(P)/FAD-dependent oxidoreductase [Bryobacter aggregatus]|uniref:NAD(P)/FAD-dependent oxidoreductase n=1 Tax=Bryobacter aggregatus TaxID=360054 RepID=UPI0004E1DA1F|nr:FAD-dependent oxidoreductase [Bryobacter aggregatus]